MKILVFITSILTILTGIKIAQYSNGGPQKYPIVVKIPEIKEYSTVKLSDINVDDVQYISLETTQHSLFSDINHPLATLKIIDEDIYISNGQNILRFNLKGDFICQIGSRGKGPNEYLNSHDYYADKTNEMVFVLSKWEDKIYIYSLMGEFIKSIKCPANTTKIICDNDKLLCYCSNIEGNAKNSFYLIDYEGYVIKSFINKYQYQRGKIMSGFISECFLYKIKNQVNIKELHSDTIFIYDNFELSPKFILDRGKRRFPVKARIVNSEEEGRKIKEPYIVEYQVFEFGEFIISDFLYNSQFASFIISKSGEQYFFKVFDNGIVNDIDGGPNIFLDNPKDKNAAVAWINAYELKHYVSSLTFKTSTPKYPEKKKELEKLANSLDENDNPVLMLVKLKE